MAARGAPRKLGLAMTAAVATWTCGVGVARAQSESDGARDAATTALEFAAGVGAASVPLLLNATLRPLVDNAPCGGIDCAPLAIPMYGASVSLASVTVLGVGRARGENGAYEGALAGSLLGAVAVFPVSLILLTWASQVGDGSSTSMRTTFGGQLLDDTALYVLPAIVVVAGAIIGFRETRRRHVHVHQTFDSFGLAPTQDRHGAFVSVGFRF